MLICSDVRDRRVAVLISSLFFFPCDTNLSHFAVKVRHAAVHLAVVQFGVLFSGSIVALLSHTVRCARNRVSGKIGF